MQYTTVKYFYFDLVKMSIAVHRRLSIEEH
jgi:hypothetical protein